MCRNIGIRNLRRHCEIACGQKCVLQIFCANESQRHINNMYIFCICSVLIHFVRRNSNRSSKKYNDFSRISRGGGIMNKQKIDRREAKNSANSFLKKNKRRERPQLLEITQTHCEMIPNTHFGFWISWNGFENNIGEDARQSMRTSRNYERYSGSAAK